MMTAVPRLLLVCLLAAHQTVPIGGQGYAVLPPVDEAPRQADFLAFRARLQAAVAARDAKAVLAVVDPNIRNTFGDDDGLEAFERMWRPEQADSRLWAELGAVLALGGSFTGTDTFVAPYTFSRWPGRFDGFEYVPVVGSNVNVRSSRSVVSPALTTVSFAIVKRISDGSGEEPWTSVQLADGRIGFVASRYVRSPIDYRARFVRQGSEWKMVTLIAGD